MLPSELRSLSELLSDADNGVLWSLDASVALDGLRRGTCLDRRLEELRGRSVLIATKEQITAALAAIELDGIARRLVLYPASVSLDYLNSVAEMAEVDAVVLDEGSRGAQVTGAKSVVHCRTRISDADLDRTPHGQTEWILLTSGTTGAPKLVLHTLSSLTGAIKRSSAPQRDVVWSTFYDIRRYGGLQIFLRALIGHASLVLSATQESTSDFLVRAGIRGVTHISGTPSHWRRALMSPLARSMAPSYVRLSGEIADQAILDKLRALYPKADVAHAFASTEAGVAFAVGDGLEGFPASLITPEGPEVQTKIVDGSLRIRSARTARRYVGARDGTIRDRDGFVDTGDMIERRGDRCYFVGRKGGIVNVGGQKVHPEEVEAVINRHPSVQMSLVRARKNPITGAVVVADVVVKADAGDAAGSEALKNEILAACRSVLAPHKVPAAIRFVPSLEVAVSGKLARSNA